MKCVCGRGHGALLTAVEEVTSEQRLKGNEGRSHEDIRRESHLGKGRSQCKRLDEAGSS